MNLVIVEPAEIDDRGYVALRGPRVTHIISVLGATPGQTIRVGLLDGPPGRAEVRSVSDEEVELTARSRQGCRAGRGSTC
jgi:16S rRNA (uracil1498-N3)-methyltransferase